MICSGCGHERPMKARGLCKACYTQWQKTGSTERVRMRRGAQCSVEGCERAVKGRGLCEKHLVRLRRTGTLDKPVPSPETHRTLHPLYPQWVDYQRKQNARPVVAEWKASFDAFLAGVGEPPFRGARLHRIDTSQPMGPGNFEWRKALIEKLPGESQQAYNARYHRAHREQFGIDYQGSQLRRRYGLELKEVQVMAEAQDYKCAICGNPETEMRNGLPRHLAVDHDHTTGQIRGLLCQACNTGLGKFKDDPLVLAKAIAYLARHATIPMPAVAE